MRLNGKTKVEFLADVEHDYRLFPPLLLVTFVENCFKYGVSSIDESVIKITLTGEDDLLTFTTINRIFSKGGESGRDGLENCKKRLEVGFPGLYTLDIKYDGEYYSVHLTIKYTERC